MAAEKLKLDPEQAAAVAMELGAASKIAGEFNGAEKARKAALEKLAGSEVALLVTRDQNTVKGKVQKIMGYSLTLEVKFKIGAQWGSTLRERPVQGSGGRGAGEARCRPYAPKDADGQVALAHSGAGPQGICQPRIRCLAAAGEHVLAARYREQLDVMKLGAVEAAAKESWEKTIVPLIL